MSRSISGADVSFLFVPRACSILNKLDSNNGEAFKFADGSINRALGVCRVTLDVGLREVTIPCQLSTANNDDHLMLIGKNDLARLEINILRGRYASFADDQAAGFDLKWKALSPCTCVGKGDVKSRALYSDNVELEPKLAVELDLWSDQSLVTLPRQCRQLAEAKKSSVASDSNRSGILWDFWTSGRLNNLKCKLQLAVKVGSKHQLTIGSKDFFRLGLETDGKRVRFPSGESVNLADLRFEYSTSCDCGPSVFESSTGKPKISLEDVWVERTAKRSDFPRTLRVIRPELLSTANLSKSCPPDRASITIKEFHKAFPLCRHITDQKIVSRLFEGVNRFIWDTTTTELGLAVGVCSVYLSVPSLCFCWLTYAMTPW